MTSSEPGSHAARQAGLRAAFAAGGEAGALMAQRDWAATSLGPVEQWSPGLISVVSVLLASRAQIVLFWGPDRVAFYNDAYRPTIGDKHPQALGRPARESWPEMWDDLAPLLDGVYATGRSFSADNRPFSIERRGFLEDVYFDVSYDPVRLEDGRIGGVFCIVSETTLRVVAERRLRLISRLNAALSDATDGASVIQGFLGALEGADPDVAWVRLTLYPNAAVGASSVETGMGQVPGFARTHRPGASVEELRPPASDRVVADDGAPPVAALCMPLRPSGRLSLGAIIVGVDEAQALDTEYRQLLLLLAERLTIALANAAVFEAEHTVSITLQQAILPERLPDVAGVELAAVYLPATAGLEVGGDWYDAVALPDGRVALAIGDVAGKGLRAAIQMSQLRSALRAYLHEQHGPADALTRLHALARDADELHFATVLVAVLDPDVGALSFASAGHLPALALEPDGAAGYLPTDPGPPIGAASVPGRYVDRTWRLAPGATLVMYTDGLVERRRESLDASLLTAAEALADTGNTASGVIATLIARRPAGDRDDDIAMLAVHRPR